MLENDAQGALFAPVDPDAGRPGPLLEAADETIADLKARGLLTTQHALMVALIRSTAQAADRGLRWGKVSVATTTLVRELHDLMNDLPGKVEGGDTFTEAYLAFLESIDAPVPE